jgi:hypothetical protein
MHLKRVPNPGPEFLKHEKLKYTEAEKGIFWAFMKDFLLLTPQKTVSLPGRSAGHHKRAVLMDL